MGRAAVAGLLAVAVAACASRGDVETMGASLRGDIDALADGQRVLISQLTRGLDSIGNTSARMETTNRGEMERRMLRLEDLLEQMLEGQSQNNQLLADIYEEQRRTSAQAPGGGPVGGPDEPGGAPPGSDDAAQFYGLALDQYRRGNLESARGAFRDFLAVNGTHELAPDAQYWLARTYEDDGDLGGALEEYRRVSELFPDSNRAPAALFRRASIEAERGNTALARQLFTQIETGYPQSPEAPEARRERQRLGG